MKSNLPGLCDRCQALDFHTLLNEVEIPREGLHVTSVGKPSRTLKYSGCKLCLFFHSLAPTYIRRHELHVRLFDHICSPSWRKRPNESPGIRMPFMTVVRKNSRLRYDEDISYEIIQNGLFIFAKRKDSANAGVAHVGTAVDYSLVGSQIRQCVDTHKACQQNEQVVDDPARVLLIDCEALSIVESTIDEQYLTLSYVWGRQPSRGAMKANEQLENAPQTVRDAMCAVKGLGYRYLWVDRFCIDQNDALARAKMIANMDLIYERSIATIVALHGDNDQAGLPGVSTTARIPQLRVECNSGFLISSGPPVAIAMERSKWSTRGWTYQEARLSRRCIFFSSTQVYVVCRESTWSEAVPFAPSSNSIAAEINTARLDGNLFGRREISHAISRDRLMYTRRDLTFPGDALDAFRGILRRSLWVTFWGVPVKLKQSCTNPDDSFAIGLLWIKRPGWMRDAHLKVQTTRAVRRTEFPTWSWTSLATEIHQDGYGVQSPYGRFINGEDADLPYNEARIRFSLEIDAKFVPLIDILEHRHFESLPETSKRLLVKGYIVSLRRKTQDNHSWYQFSDGWRYFRPDIDAIGDKSPGRPSSTALEDSEEALILIQWLETNRPNKTRFVLMLLNWVGDALAERKGLLTEYRGEVDVAWVKSLPRAYKEFILQ